jgi:ribose transport system ATP-binding protein
VTLARENLRDATPVAADRAARFAAEGLGKAFSGVPVLADVSFTLRAGEVLALLGENGAGKSTLSALIAGLLRPDGGAMRWEGRPYAPASPGEAMAAGIGLIHQEMRLLPDLSIAENVFAGRLPMRGGRVDRALMNQRARAQLQRLGLDVAPTQLVRRLRVAAQQQVEIAKALTQNARLLILDEPTAALGGAESERLFAQIEQLRGEGVSFLYISHRLEEIARIADRVIVLRDGALVARHDTARVPVSTLLRDMVGRSIERIFPPLAPPAAREVLRVEALCAARGAFRDIGFAVHAGEVLGIAGIVGAGRSELVRAIYGADRLASGRLLLEGKPQHIAGPRDAIRAGIVLVPEDRKGQGVLLDQSLARNLTLGNLDRLAPDGWLRPARLRRFAAALIARLGVKGRPEQAARALSGGNQQKMVIARWLARAPQLLILDEPTRGIDVGARAAIYQLIADLAGAGMAVIIVSSELEEVLGLSHRILVLSRGRQMGILDRAEADSVAVMRLATG